MPERDTIRVSVTALANFSCRRGDLQLVNVIGPSAREGIRAHQRIQSTVLEEASAQTTGLSVGDDNDGVAESSNRVVTEARLSCHYQHGNTRIELTGRVDILDHALLKISEIKTGFVPIDALPESQLGLHWAQLYLYGYIYSKNLAVTLSERCADQDLTLELIYANLRSSNTEYIPRSVSVHELNTFAQAALNQYLDWLSRQSIARDHLIQGAEQLAFPYDDFREGQRDMAAAVYRASRDEGMLLCEAPTGIGKTMSALFPAVKSLGQEHIKQIVYLTAKKAGSISALNAIKDLRSTGLKISCLQIRSKKHVCFCSIGRCEKDEQGRCPMTRGFFDRLPDARIEAHESAFLDGETLDDIAWNHQICPFEFALQMIPWSTIVVADYNYVFDPLVRLVHFSQPHKDSLLLIDEAHNLLDRSRMMFSAELRRQDFLDEVLRCKQGHPVVAGALLRVSDQLRQLTNLEAHNSDSTPPKSLIKSVSTAIEAIVSASDSIPALPETTFETFKALCRFAVINELFSDSHSCIIKIEKQGRKKTVSVSLSCLDAAEFLKKQYTLSAATVLFSATLRPAIFYRDTLGLPDKTTFQQLDTPFAAHQSYQAIVDWIDTRYQQRTTSLSSLVKLIKQIVDQRSGNYLVFFASYAYLSQVYECFTEQYPEQPSWKQTEDQTPEQHIEHIRRLKDGPSSLGFVILGGVFGEGIDYRGDSLIGVIVVGTGLPNLTSRLQLLVNRFQARGLNGYDYACRYPAVTRILQSVGRLIRTEDDRGIIVLIDDRFNERFYQSLFPGNWCIDSPGNNENLLNHLSDFWNSTE